MKKAILCVLLTLAMSVNAFALEVPTDTVVQNLNGSQQAIKTYTIPPDQDPATLIEEPFELEGFLYTFANIVKTENPVEETKVHTEIITIETAKKDLSVVLENLEPTIEYDDGVFKGRLALDHTSIVTEAAGYTTKSYTVTETKTIGQLDRNDMSYVPATTVKDGRTLTLANVEWQVTGTDLVGEALMPSSYQAIAAYSAKASYNAATGYITTAEYVSAGRTVEIEWENEPVTGQIQIYKYAGEYNEITGTAPGTPLKGAVYEIINARSGKVVDYITTDSRGVAASKPLPLTRYQIREVSAPAYWQVSARVFDVTLEYAGQIIKLNAYDKTAELGVSITKRGNAAVLAGNQMRYDITVANTSNVDLESFYWHDRIPTDVARATTLTTGTYSARLNYRILYKTNYTANYQVLASNLLTSNNYSFALNAIPMQAGEVITDIYFDFGKVPVGFQSVSNPTLSVMVNGNAVNGYYMTNRADVGGKYLGTWQTANASWVTIIQRYGTTLTLPKTGY